MGTASLAGKTALLTGASGGLGRETAARLAHAGADTVIAARNPEKLAAARADIERRTGSKRLTAMRCDFSSQADTRRFARDFLARNRRLDVLVNNVGGVHEKRTLSDDGIEATFAVNHLAPFLLTHLLLERLKSSAPARIVNVASAMHYKGTLDFEDLGFEHGYTTLRAYARSKLANVLFTRELAKRLENTGVTANAVHPGTVATRIWDGAPGWTQPVFAVAKRIYMIKPEKGAERIAWLAGSREAEGLNGLYFEKNKPRAPSKIARNDDVAEKLWSESERLVNAASGGSIPRA